MNDTGADVALDLLVLADLLRGDGLVVDGPLKASRIGQGQSNLTYLVEDNHERRWIVRRPPRGKLLASAHDVLREDRILVALDGTGVPVPKAVARYVEAALADAPVVVMAYVGGLVVDCMEQAEALDPDLRARIGPALARALAEVHRVDIETVGLGDLASRAPYAARQLKRWSRQWELSSTRESPRLEAMTELLRQRAPEQHETTLVHGDFYLRNVILDQQTGDVRAVLDWELGTLGDPLADIGTLLAYWPEPSDDRTMVFAASTLPGFVTREQLASAYLAGSGRSGDDLGYWHTLGLWKLAVIGEGIVRRTLDDPRNAAEDGPPLTQSIDLLIEQAWESAESAGLDR